MWGVLLIPYTPVSPSSLSTFHSISVHFLGFIFSSLTFQFSFSFATDFFSSFRILLSILVSFLFITTESFLHCPCPHQELYLASLAQEPWEMQAPSKGKRWQCFGDCSADRAWVCHSRHELTELEWLPIFTAGHFPFALVGLLQSWKLHLLGLYRLKNLKYFLWDRALTKGSIHQKYDAMDFHNPVCRQTALDKCVFIIAAELSSAFPPSFSLKVRKIKFTL